MVSKTDSSNSYKSTKNSKISSASMSATYLCMIEKRDAQGDTSKKKERQTLTTDWLNQEMRPYLFRYPAIAMRAANHVRVSQATDSAKHSFHVTTPVTRRTDNPRMAAVTASTFSIAPNIQRPT